MSSAEKCHESGCEFFANASGYCSQHNPSRVVVDSISPASVVISNREKRESRREALEWLNRHSRFPNNEKQKPKRYLVLGASPDEERHGRTHYDRKNVWLLGHEPKHD